MGDLYITVRSICIRSISIKRLSSCIDILLWKYLGLPWLILWYEKLYPVFDKPKMYYRVKAWFISLKEQSTVGMCIYSCIDFLIKLCLITYGTMVVLAGFILAGAILVLPLLMILRLILH